jgi:tripartite-type tricarboxylate transporter receptor subunit TctC
MRMTPRVAASRSLSAAVLAVTLALVAAGVGPSTAQEPFPGRPITLVVGFAPGGGADVFGRALADAVKTTLPRPLVIENRPGAGGTNAAAYATGRPADGYTLLFGHAGSTILTPVIGNTPNLMWSAFEPVARVQGEEEFLFLRPDSPWKTIDDVAAFAKQNPGRFRVGGSAVGGIDSFVILTWKKAAGLDVTYVPFEGGGPATLSFLGGNVDMLVGNVSDSIANLEAKRMFPVAVASERRSPIFPDVPTLREKGWDVVLMQWRGVLAPKGTPPDRLRTIADAFQKALATDSWKSFRDRTKSIDLFLGPAEFRAFLAAEEARFVALIDELGLRKK